MTNRSVPFLAAALAALASACGSTPKTETPCLAGQACASDVYVACFASDEVKGLTRDLQPSGVAHQAVGDGPVSLALAGDTLWVAHSLGAPEVDRITAGGTPVKYVLSAGGDLESLRVRQGRVYVSNANLNTVTVLDAVSGQVVDEVSMSATAGAFVNPRGVDFVGTRAFVALPGGSDASASLAVAQEVAVVDFSGAGRVVKHISMGVPGASDASGLPFPYSLLAAGTRVYVALANLKPGGFGFYTDPAGDGRLAVIDTAAGDAVSTVDLGAGCVNPSRLALEGSTLWVACAGGSVLPVAVGGLAPVVGTPIATPAGVVPGSIAVCRGIGYVTDQFSGTVVRFDTATRAITGSADVCPVVSQFAFAADVACAP